MSADPLSPSELQTSHTPARIRERLAGKSMADHHVRDFVYGAIDGAVTTFAVVAGVAGAGLNEGIIILLGIANLAADGFSMAASNFLGTRADDQAREKVRREEHQHIALYPKGEREEIRQIFAGKGFKGADLERIVEVITEDEQRWVDTMLQEEHGFSTHRPSAWRAALVTFSSFIIIGAIPLLSYVTNWILPGTFANPFLWSCLLTGIAFSVVGAMKSLFAIQHWSVSAMETLAVGSLAASIAYLLGEALQGLA